jgi:hypothetical protein
VQGTDEWLWYAVQPSKLRPKDMQMQRLNLWFPASGKPPAIFLYIAHLFFPTRYRIIFKMRKDLLTILDH